MKKQQSPWSKYNHNPFFSEYYDGSMFGCLKKAADRWPDHTALEFEGKKTSYKTFISQIETCAKALVKHGVKKGDYVTVVTPNTTMALVFIYAVNRIGAISNLLHPLLSQEEIKKFIEETDSKVIVTLDQIYPKFKKYKFKEGLKPIFVLTPIGDALPGYKAFFYNIKNKVKVDLNPEHTVVMWREWMSGNDGMGLQNDDGQGDDTAVIMYSGGTTGIPKGTLISNMAENALAGMCFDVYGGDNFDGIHTLAVMPNFHGFGLGISMHAMLTMGCHVFVVPKYEMESTAKLIFKRKISFIYGVPALFHALSRTEEIETKDLSFMKHLVVAGDRVPVSLINRMNKYLKSGGSDAVLLEAYGQTECAVGCAINPFFMPKVGSFGIPFPDTKVKICEPGTQKEVGTGVTGEICVNGPTVMKGYLHNPQETKRALQIHEDGLTWLHTSDLAHMDEDGYLYFDGRASRLIITSGYNVYPQELERIIDELPFVRESCVIGLPDPVISQRVTAYWVPANDVTKTEADTFGERIMEHLRDNVAEYALPVEIILRDELPETSLGKVDSKKVMEDEINHA